MPGLASLGSYGPPLPEGIPNRRGGLVVGKTIETTLEVATSTHLPSGASYDVESGVGPRVTCFSSAGGWNFSQLGARLRLGDGVLLEQCVLGLSPDYAVNNRAYISPQGAGAAFGLSHCDIEGRNFTGAFVTQCIGSNSLGVDNGPSLIEYCKVTDWPSDWISGVRGIAGHSTIIKGNYARITGVQGSTNFHPDGIQLIQWDAGDGLFITGNVIDIRSLPGQDNHATAPINFSLQGGASPLNGNWSVACTVGPNILIGGSNSIYCTGAGEGTATGAMDFDYQYVSDYVNGRLYAVQPVMSTLTMRGLKDANTGAALTFPYNNGSSTTTVSSVP